MELDRIMTSLKLNHWGNSGYAVVVEPENGQPMRAIAFDTHSFSKALEQTFDDAASDPRNHRVYLIKVGIQKISTKIKPDPKPLDISH